MVRARVFSYLLVVASIPTANAISIGGANGLTVAVDSGGIYTVTTLDPAWSFSGSIGANLTNLQTGSGADSLGTYSEITFDFQTDVPRHAAIRTYWDRSAVLFTVKLPSSGAANTFTFPNFTQYPHNLDHVTFSGTFAPPSFWNLDSASPWIYFDSSANTFILSPAANFMTAATSLGPHAELASGISTAIAALPQGFEHSTLLVIAKGINRAFETWGHTLTGLYGKARPANDADTTLQKVGYWTDNGATYYYQMAASMSYEQTLAAVKNNFDRLGIGLGYLQLDSWFYPKGPGASWSNNGQGIYQYVAASPPFADGLPHFQQGLGVPLVTHARWIDASSPYRKTYQMSGNVVIDPAYWESVAGYLANSGVATYEQDWLNDQAHTDFNLNDADAFLDNMAASMGRRNLTMQYCMASARHFMQSAKYNNLTTIRTSADRLSRDKWSDFLYTSRLASALGAWPFTDNFLSTETSHMLLATLSAGPIGIGDGLGAINAANLLHAVRRDGVIVKPDVPLTPTDASFSNMSHGTDTPQIATTYSDFGGLRTNYLFAYTQGNNAQVNVSIDRPTYVYDYFAGSGQAADTTDVIQKQITGDSLYLVLAPIGKSGMAIVGDTGQFVTMGKKRVTAVVDDGTVRLTVAFAQGETARTITGFSPWPPSAEVFDGSIGTLTYDRASQRFQVQVKPGQTGTASIRIRRATRMPVGHATPALR